LSHIVEIQTQVKDVTAIRTACDRLQLDPPQQGTFKLFSGEATGFAVQLPDWKYPVVANIQSGELKYDNFNGRWGDQQQLDKFLQAYAVEKAKLEARKQGHTVTEQQQTDGSIRLAIQVAGGAL
jgi:hypothetical protein